MRKIASPLESMPPQTAFSAKHMSPNHYETTSDAVGQFYYQAATTDTTAARTDTNMVRGPTPSAYYIRQREPSIDDKRPSVGRKAPAAFPRLSEGMQGSIMKSPGLMWQASPSSVLSPSK